MIEIMSTIALGGIALFLTFLLVKGYEECKTKGYIFNGDSEER